MNLRFLLSLSRRIESLNHQLQIKTMGEDTWKIIVVNRYDRDVVIEFYTTNLEKDLLDLDGLLDDIDVARG